MSDDRALTAQILAEFERLGLRLDESPYQAFASGPGGPERFLAELRAMRLGVTWRDVFPDVPAHWELGRRETSLRPYRPLGSFDYPAPPTGPAVHVHWPEGVDASPLEAFVVSARTAGWPVHGAGVVEQLRERSRQFHAYVVLERSTDEETFDGFLAWIEEQRGVEIAIITRPVAARYLE